MNYIVCKLIIVPATFDFCPKLLDNGSTSVPLRETYFYSYMIRPCNFLRTPQIRRVYTHPLACNPKRIPYELARVFIQSPFMHWVMQRGLYAKER